MVFRPLLEYAFISLDCYMIWVYCLRGCSSKKMIPCELSDSFLEEYLFTEKTDFSNIESLDLKESSEFNCQRKGEQEGFDIFHFLKLLPYIDLIWFPRSHFYFFEVTRLFYSIPLFGFIMSSWKYQPLLNKNELEFYQSMFWTHEKC